MPTLITKKSTVAGKVPVAGDLSVGELAVNTADKKLYTKHSDNSIVGLSTDLASPGAIGETTPSTVKTTELISTSGVLAESTYTGAYTDGILIDHVTGNGRITVGGADGIQFYNGGPNGNLLGEVTDAGNWDLNGSLRVGTGAPIGGATNPLGEFSGDTNQFIQVYVANNSSGTSASSDISVYTDTGTDASGWADLGISSSGYADVNYTVTGPGEGYVLMSASAGESQTGNFVSATDSTGTSNAFQWYVGGFTQAKSAYKMQLDSSNLTLQVPLSSTVATGTAPFTVASTTQVANLNAATAGTAEAVPWTGVTDKPSTFTPSAHTHVIGDVTGLQTALDGKEASGTVATHEAALDPHPQYTTLTEIASVTKDIHGFVDRTSTTLSFVEATRTFSITPVASTWSVYILGSLKTITGALSVVIPNTTGGVFVRVNSAGTALETVAGVPDFANDVYAIYIYWNATTGKALIVGDERHSSARDTTWHSNQHLNVGTVWRSGGAVSYTLNDASTINIGLATPIRIADEDLLHVINHSASPTADYEQILNTSALLEVLYLDGTAYTTTTPSTSPWIAGTSTARYNLVTGGSGSLVDAGEGKYITYWLLATNDIRRPVKLVLGRQAHDTVDAAYNETFTDYGISFAEQVFMHQLVLKTSTSFANTAKVVIAAVRKITEKLASSGATYSAGAHSELTGRDTADQHPIGAITGLQTALDAKQDDLVSGTSIKTVNSTSLLGSGDIAVQTPLVSGTSIKTVNSTSLLGSGDIAVQPTLVSGTSIKTVNSTSILGSGDIAVQPTLVSGISIKTVNSTSILGSGDIAVQPTLVSGTSIKTVNSTSILGSGDIAVQDTLVSGTNIKTINGNTILGSGDLTISGGSGSPGGATTNIQYNNAGAFAGSANFTYDSTTNTFSLKGTDPEFVLGVITTEPASPAASHVAIYAKSIAGRILPKWKGPSGFDTPFQALIAQNKIAWWNPPGNATTVPGVLGIAAPTSLGTATARNVATTNAFTRARRLGYNSAATAGQAGGHYSGTAQYTLGNAAGLGGFYYVCRFGSADTLASAIMFVGLSSSTATPTVTASPATFTNCIGVGCATGDTNLSIYYGGSAAQTPIALGASFPAKTNSVDLYELILFAGSNVNNQVGYRVQNVSTGVMAEGILTAATAGTQLPAATTLLAHRAYRSNNATATAVLMDIVSVYIETDT